MLAALLCNLESAPPPPAVQPARFFGGGPFLPRYGFPRKDYEQEIPEEDIQAVEEAVEQAVEAIRSLPEPEPYVYDAQQIYERIYSRLAGEVGMDVRMLWKQELDRRLKEREDEEVICLLLSL